MKPLPFRLRLTLWYTALLAGAQLLFAVVLALSAQGLVLHSLDRELWQRAQHFAQLSPEAQRQFSRVEVPDLPPPPAPPGHDTQPPPPPPPWHRPLQLPPRVVTTEDQALDARAFRAALRGRFHYSVVRFGPPEARILSLPWPVDGPTTAVLQLGADLRDVHRLGVVLRRLCLLLVPLSVLLAGAGGLLLTNRALRPLRDVTAAAAEIGAHDLSRRLAVVGHDELSELASTFNAMVARLEASFEQQRQFTADASHELRTPLARIKVATSLALGAPPDEAEDRAALAVADRAANVMTRLLDQLLALARADAGQLVLERLDVDAGELLAEAVALLPPDAAARVDLRLPAEPLSLSVDPDLLTRVLLNLLDNALRHSQPDGRVTACARLGDDGGCELCVSDHGEGIAPEHLERLGQRFYRVDPARSRKHGGTGLGLAICHSLVAAHGGTLSFASELGVGTTATLRL